MEALVLSDVFLAHILPKLDACTVGSLMCTTPAIARHMSGLVRTSHQLYQLLDELVVWCTACGCRVGLEFDICLAGGAQVCVLLDIRGAGGDVTLHVQHTLTRAHASERRALGMRQSDLGRYRNRQYTCVTKDTAARHLPFVCKLIKGCAATGLAAEGTATMEMERGRQFLPWQRWMEGMGRIDRVRRFLGVSETRWRIGTFVRAPA